MLSACAEEHLTVGSTQFGHWTQLKEFLGVSRHIAGFSTVGMVFQLLVDLVHKIETNNIMASC